MIRRIHAQELGQAVSPRKIKPMKINGRWVDREALLMPGYVFVYNQEETPLQALHQVEGVIRVLTYGEQDTRGYLTGHDLEFALRVRRNEGVWGKLEAIREGDFVRITDGVLQELQGKVVAMNRRRHTVQIELNFFGDARRLWLGYEVMERIQPESSGEEKT